MAATQAKLLDLLEQVKPEDLADMDQEIAERRKSLEALLALRKVVDQKLNGRPAREPRAKTARGVDAKIKAAKYLMHSGPKQQSVIAADCGIEAKNLTSFFTHDFFVRRGGGMIELSNEGRRAAAKNGHG